MAFCTECGESLNDNAKFCSACGTKISVETTSSVDEEPSDNGQYFATFGDHPISLRDFLSSVSRFAKPLKGIGRNAPEILEEKIAAFPIRGENADPYFTQQIDSYTNSSDRDRTPKTPLVVFPTIYSNGVLGIFRVANSGKGITQDQGLGWGTMQGKTDWLFFLENKIVFFTDNAGKEAKDYKIIPYDGIAQVPISHDALAQTGWSSPINYFHSTFTLILNNGGKYTRFLYIGTGEDERNNNIYKFDALTTFLRWKLRLDLNPQRIYMIPGTTIDNTIQTSFGFGVLREFGD